MDVVRVHLLSGQAALQRFSLSHLMHLFAYTSVHAYTPAYEIHTRQVFFDTYNKRNPQASIEWTAEEVCACVDNACLVQGTENRE